MNRLLKILLILILLQFSFLPFVKSENPPEVQKKFTISGHIVDKENGEMLAGVTIFDNILKQGTVTNAYGFYSLSLPAGKYNLQFSYIGFQTISSSGNLEKNITLDIALEAIKTELGEVIIEGKRTNENVKKPEMSMVKLDSKTINKIPAFLGEIDIIKAIQLLPGVQSTSEGSTGFSVRGGSSDQNLIILDEATVHNASHLLGFFSVFNNDAVKDVTLYKGDIPAAYGGRLSSLLDVRMRDGNMKQLGFTGSVGTVSSKLTLEGPIIKNRTTFLVSGRRTYADLFLPFAKEKDVRDNTLFFYDLNLKVSHVINENNRLYLSGYAGRDTFKNKFASMGFGNQTGSLRWNHLFSKKIFFNLSAIYSRYNYKLGTPQDDANAFEWTSQMRDHALRFDFTHYISPLHTLRYGATGVFHEFFPGTASSGGNNNARNKFKLPTQFAFEPSIYSSDEWQMTKKLTLKYGIRFSLFQNMGPGTYYRFDSSYNPIDSIVYTTRKIFNTYKSFEPRISFNYLLSETSSIKGSYSYTQQFLALAQNSTAGTPLDIWFPSTPNVKPQTCHQGAIGYFRNFQANMYEFSGEIYFKKFGSVIDFRDHANLLLNQYLEGEIRIGKGYSYGIEFLVRKNIGELTGWISYTYSRSIRKIEEINEGNAYPAPYDKPHAISIVGSYAFTKRFSASMTWVYATGIPITLPTGRAIIGNTIIPIYSDRNSFRMPDYHRLDFSATLKNKNKKNKRWNSEWNFSVYNAYNRHNAWSINFTQDSNDSYVTYAEKTYLFAIIPAITYNFKF